MLEAPAGLPHDSKLMPQMYAKQAEEVTQDLQQQHAKCAHTLRRQAANAEPYLQVRFPQMSRKHGCFHSAVV